jgi:hypothetical protein
MAIRKALWIPSAVALAVAGSWRGTPHRLRQSEYES